MIFRSKRKFLINMGLVNLAVDLALSEAIRCEVERQFVEQFPGSRLVPMLRLTLSRTRILL